MANTIIITGAGSGIGRVTARTFLAAGWRVGLIGRREEALRESADGQAGALVLPCDVCDAGAVDAAFDRAAAEWGRLDVLFNNAGTGLVTQTPDEVDPDEFRRVIEVNVNGVFICARAAFRVMRAQDPQGGRIINNGSVSAHAPRPGSIAYTTSKHAVTGITRSVSLDGRAFNIACGQIDIGNALTDMAVAMTRGVPQADGSLKVEPVMDAQVVADTVMHMASLPEGANVQFVTVMATNMPFVGRG
ncbi:NADP-dependent 3-hydroxy acid dehydrogenase YdfG [Paracoccus solventivorans]|uniref:NADP-dependent 3-hydroxy acid dehydrogenase YdfG n=1 Tax=Paracoccus solventivorans TaxID=53463 RepID=A0A1M7GGA1_9RHOB|nr:SDR family oxidoreductase [Paracoccus solventivorans]SHM15323.1 NADP-dependent 3-hydroxy acid dehydrogenase YdfG [Paracoccus solventivorans]